MNDIDILEEKEKKAIKDLKELSHYCSLRAIDIDNKHSDLWASYIVSIQIVKNLIENLISENKELKENQIWSEATIEGLKRDFILKSKVEEKIEKIGDIASIGNDLDYMYAKGQYELCKELLGKE